MTALLAPAAPVTFAERLQQLIKARRLTQKELAEKLGVSANYIWQLSAGTKTPGPKLLREIELMEASPTHLPALGAAKPAPRLTDAPGAYPLDLREVSVPLPRHIPVVSWCHAGEAATFEEIPISWQERIPTDVSDPKAIAIEVRGDSMEPHYREGDRVIVLPSEMPRNGDVVVCKLASDGIVLKIYHENRDGREIRLTSYNPVYGPLDLRAEEIQWVVPVDSVVKKVRR